MDFAAMMREALERAEKALRAMTWRPTSVALPKGIAKSYEGIGKLDGATCIGTVCVYFDHQDEVRFDGAVTLGDGNVVRLTPGLAEIGVGLAEKPKREVVA